MRDSSSPCPTRTASTTPWPTVTQSESSGRLLHRLERTNLSSSPTLLDEWVRFHPLLVTFARSSLEVSVQSWSTPRTVVVNSGSPRTARSKRGAHLLAGDAYDEASMPSIYLSRRTGCASSTLVGQRPSWAGFTNSRSRCARRLTGQTCPTTDLRASTETRTRATVVKLRSVLSGRQIERRTPVHNLAGVRPSPVQRQAQSSQIFAMTDSLVEGAAAQGRIVVARGI